MSTNSTGAQASSVTADPETQSLKIKFRVPLAAKPKLDIIPVTEPAPKDSSVTPDNSSNDNEFVLLAFVKSHAAYVTQPADIDMSLLQFHGQEIPEGYG